MSKDIEGRFLGSLYGHGTGYAGAVWDTQSVCPTLTTMQGGGRQPHIVETARIAENVPDVFQRFVYEIDGGKYLVRIRRLTPLECWRLMGFTDEDFKKAASVVSNTQLYKQAGNSIVKQVLMAVFSQMVAPHKGDK